MSFIDVQIINGQSIIVPEIPIILNMSQVRKREQPCDILCRMKDPKKIKSHRVSTSDDIEVSTYLEIAKEKQGVQAAPEPGELPHGTKEAIAIIDFGSQYSHLIARRVRECNVYCELFHFETPLSKIMSIHPRGFILSGGPASVYEKNAPLTPVDIYESHLPVLGICYGMQVITHQLGGAVAPGSKREYGQAVLHVSEENSPLFYGLEDSLTVWMSHGDQITEMPPGFRSSGLYRELAQRRNYRRSKIFGLQFHPEVAHTPAGKTYHQELSATRSAAATAPGRRAISFTRASRQSRSRWARAGSSAPSPAAWIQR